MSIVDKICGKIGLGDPVEEQKHEGAEDFMEYDDEQRKNSSPGNIVNFHAASSGDNPASRQMKVMIIEPASFDDAQQVADHLKNRKPVVVNFENTDAETAKRIIDFISGTTYALAGDIKKVGKNVFLCAPSNVNVAYTQEDGSALTNEMPWLRNKE